MSRISPKFQQRRSRPHEMDLLHGSYIGRFEGVYKTPFGEMDMAVYARGVRCDIGEAKGSVHLKYQLDIQGAYASTNELHLEYAESRSDNIQ